ncbi:GNAT family N-acetyltransferase [Thiomicrorhabdus indica]|uniref:GNAT family N-acetyltransferase n=1 Tax=Thiomicrorhabdus indica TaxID=2267253 RepID=UPI00102D7517|nr:GNAT family N-acetyltransferase [Thiomicrorhabdus indica]
MTQNPIEFDVEVNENLTRSNDSVNAALAKKTQQFIDAFQQTLPNAIANIATELNVYSFNEISIPVAKNQTDYRNSYVCSAYNAYIDYASEELHLIKNPMQRTLIKATFPIFSTALKWGKINQTLSLNNWLFSTCPFPATSKDTLQKLTQTLSQQHPKHSLSIRSLNSECDGQLIQDLTSLGWLMLPARQVYLFPNETNWWKKNNVKNDWRLLRKTPLSLVTPKEHRPVDFKDIQKCFYQLYIEKHSQHNPQYSTEYLQQLHKNKLVEFFSFRNDEGRIVATMGLFTHNNILTMPIVGYDTTLPKSMGLYRLTIAQLLKIAHERHQLLNLSSGAAHFKKQRGGIAAMEFTGYYCAHLPMRQQLLLKSLHKLFHHYAENLFAKNEI